MVKVYENGPSPEMIAAAIYELGPYYPDEDTAEDAVKRIFSAMFQVGRASA